MPEKSTRWILAAALIVQLILLSAQVRSAETDQSLLESSLLRFVGPLAQVVGASSQSFLQTSGYFAQRRALREENARLTQELEELRKERVRVFGIEDELERLSEASQYERLSGRLPRVADVIHLDYGSWQQTLVLYVGSRGAVRQQPVVTSQGLVGRVVVPAGRYAKVQLITDRSASVGAMMARTRRQGVVRGGAGGYLELDFVPLQEDVAEGDLIVTAGIDGVYPRGLPIGTVISVTAGHELFHEIRLVPTVDLGQLAQVYLLEATDVPPELLETNGATP